MRSLSLLSFLKYYIMDNGVDCATSSFHESALGGAGRGRGISISARRAFGLCPRCLTSKASHSVGKGRSLACAPRQHLGRLCAPYGSTIVNECGRRAAIRKGGGAASVIAEMPTRVHLLRRLTLIAKRRSLSR
jgi:hypothetical protein